MLSLTGRPLLVLTVLLAILAVLGVVLLVHRATGASGLTRPSITVRRTSQLWPRS